MKKKIFVTGAAGFVGSHLVPTLLDKNYEVTALIRKSSEKPRLPKVVSWVIADLSKKGSWQAKLEGHDILIHLASEISSKIREAFEKNNVVATKNLIEAAKKARIKKIIHFSSAAVESIRRDWYADTKKEQEKIIANSKINHIILRPSMMYGPGDNKNIGWLIKIFKKLPIIPLPGGGNFGRQPVYVDDICKIVIKLIERNYKNRIFEIHGYRYIPMSKMVKVITKNLTQFKPSVHVPLFFLFTFFAMAEKILPDPKFTTDQIRSLVSGEKFKGDKWWETFGIIPTSFEKGVKSMINAKNIRN